MRRYGSAEVTVRYQPQICQSAARYGSSALLHMRNAACGACHPTLGWLGRAVYRCGVDRREGRRQKRDRALTMLTGMAGGAACSNVFDVETVLLFCIWFRER